MKALIRSTSQLKSGISYFISSSLSTTLKSIKIYFNYILRLTIIKNTKINERKLGKHDRIINRFTIQNTTFYNNSLTKQCGIKRHTKQNFTRITNTTVESNSKITEFKTLATASLKELSSPITESMTSFFNHQEKLNSFSKQLEKARNYCGSIWKKSLNTKKQSFWYHCKSSRLVSIYNDLLQHELPKMPPKLQQKFIPNEAPKVTKFLKDLAVEKFKSEIKLHQTRIERHKQRISKLDCDMIAYLQTYFDEDIVAELSQQWK